MRAPRVILIAEDDVLVRNLIHLVLTRASYSVLAANDGLEALEVSRHYPGHIHLLLSDIVMPNMDGVALAAALRGERPDTPALLISGKTSADIVRENATFDFLRKPFLPAELMTKIEEILSRVDAGEEVTYGGSSSLPRTSDAGRESESA